MSNFKKDLDRGKLGENCVKTLLENCGFECEVAKGRNSAYDIEVRLKKFKTTIEVKYDYYSQISGNMFFETFNPKLNKPSGVYSSEAILFCYVLPDDVHRLMYVVKTDLLKNFLKNESPLRLLTKAGDGNSSGAIYKIETALKVFKRLDNLEKEAVIKLIKKESK